LHQFILSTQGPIPQILAKKYGELGVIEKLSFTQWFVNDGAAKDPPETRCGCFSGRRGKISCNYSTKLNLCMAGTTANLFYLRKTSQGQAGFPWVSRRSRAAPSSTDLTV
jgi:hypothetical protein